MKKFKNSPYLGYKSEQDRNEPPEAFFFIIKKITKLIKIKGLIHLHTKGVKWGVNEKLGHINETIGRVKTKLNLRNRKSTT